MLDIFSKRSSILDALQNSKCDSAQKLSIAGESSEKLPAVSVGNLVLPLSPNSIDLHQTQRQQDEIFKKRENNSFPYKQGDKMLPVRSRF